MPSNVLRAALLLSLFALDAEAARAAKKPPGVRKPRPSAQAKSSGGEVQFVTAFAAYLDRGSADGLKPGDRLTLMHGSRQSGTCVLQEVAEHSATCPAGSLARGDTFAVTAPAPPAKDAPPPVASPEEILRRNAELQHQPFERVDFSGAAASIGRPRVTVAFTQASYSNFLFFGGPYQQQTIDARVYDVDLYKGLHVSLDLSVLTFSRSPATDRAAPAGLTSPALLVRQAEISFHRPDVPFFGALGRTWLRAPGLLTVDGAQAGWRSSADGLTLGVFGGFLPSPVNTAPQFDQFAAGLFGIGRIDGKASQVELDVRANWANRLLGGRFEAAVGAHAFVGKAFDVHAAVEAGLGSGQGRFGLDAVRVDLGVRPSDALQLYGGVRYIGVSPTDIIDVGAASAYLQDSLHADLGLRWEPTAFLWLGFSGTTSNDLEATHQVLADGSTLLHSFTDIGPDLTLPSLLGPLGGATLGYREEFGWLRGRSGFVQLNLSVARRLRLLARASWYQQAPGGNNDGLLGHELGATITADVTLLRWLWVRAVISGRSQLSSSTDPNSSLTGGMASFQLGGTL